MKSLLAIEKLRLVAPLLVVIAALALFARATAAVDRDEFLAYGYEIAALGLYAARGTATALSVFAAGWLIWGAGKLVARLAVSLSLIITILMIWHRLYVPDLPWNVVSQYASSVITFLGATVLFAGANRLGVCFARPAGRAVRARRQWQVSILDLLMMTSGVAVISAALRGSAPPALSNWRLSEDELLWLTLHCISNLLIVATIVSCHHERRAWWINVLLSSGLSAIVAAMHISALSRILELPLMPVDPALAARGIHHLIHVSWLLGGLGALRLAGLHLIRIAPAADSRPDGLVEAIAPAAT